MFNSTPICKLFALLGFLLLIAVKKECVNHWSSRWSSSGKRITSLYITT